MTQTPPSRQVWTLRGPSCRSSMAVVGREDRLSAGVATQGLVPTGLSFPICPPTWLLGLQGVGGWWGLPEPGLSLGSGTHGVVSRHYIFLSLFTATRPHRTKTDLRWHQGPSRESAQAHSGREEGKRRGVRGWAWAALPEGESRTLDPAATPTKLATRGHQSSPRPRTLGPPAGR